MDADNIIGSLLVAAIVGLVTAVVHLWREQNTGERRLSSLELKIAEKYLTKGDLDEVKTDVREIRHLVHRLCDKLEVPVVTEPYR